MKLILVNQKDNPNAEKDVGFFQKVAAELETSLDCMHDIDAVCSVLEKEKHTLILLDVTDPQFFQDFEGKVQEKLGVYNNALNSNYLFYLASQAFHEASFLGKSDLFGTYIQRAYSPNVEVDTSLMKALFQSAFENKMPRLESFFPRSIVPQFLQLQKTSQKKPILEAFKSQLLKIGFQQRAVLTITTAIDELLMNAIFDAPINEVGQHHKAEIPRASDFDLDEHDRVDLKVSFDGQLLGICVGDNHGSLDKKKVLLNHLAKSYESEQYRARALTIGAGLGLNQVFKNCGGMILSCQTGIRTEVTLFYRKTSSFKQFRDQFRFLSTLDYF